MVVATASERPARLTRSHVRRRHNPVGFAPGDADLRTASRLVRGGDDGIRRLVHCRGRRRAVEVSSNLAAPTTRKPASKRTFTIPEPTERVENGRVWYQPGCQAGCR